MTYDHLQTEGPPVSVVGVNYSNTSVSMREKLSFSRSQLSEAYELLSNYVSQGVILATCNRTEVYVIDDENRSAEKAVRNFYEKWSGLSEEQLEPHIYCSHDYIAMRHLSRIASGLYSMIIGEHEILGQVRQALEDAESHQMVTLPLRNLFQHTVRTGRRVREETALSKNALSVSSVAVELATKATGDIHKCRVLLIGAGEAGKLVAKALTERGVSSLAVASRSIKSAQDLASVLGGDPVSIEDMYPQMWAADIVITCTGAPHYIVNRKSVENVISYREGRPLVVVDIAVPRDVEPDVKQIEGVFAYDIDDLEHLSHLNRKDREKEVEKAMQIVDDEMERLMSWWQALEAKPTISALIEMAENIRQRQLKMSLKKLPELSQDEQNVLDALTKSITTKMLHYPIQCLRQNGHRNKDFVQMVHELFCLDERGPQ